MQAAVVLLQHISGFQFLEQIIFTTCAPPCSTSANALWKQGWTGLSHEGQREGQELDNRMCCHHIKSEPRAKTFMLHARPRPLCVTEWVKLPPHCRCVDPTKSDFVGLFGLFSCVRTQVHRSSCGMKTSAGSFETPSCFRDVHTLHQVSS